MNSSFQVIVFLLQISALWVLIAFFIKDYARDRLRQNLFAIRDSLFDEALNDHEYFKSAPYKHMRRYVNQVIRRGHMITASRALMFSIFVRIPWFTNGVRFSEMKEQAAEDLKWLEEAEKSDERIKKFRRAIHNQLLQYYSVTSPIFIVAIIVGVMAVICGTGVIGITKSAQTAFDRFFARDIDRGISLGDCDNNLRIA